MEYYVAKAVSLSALAAVLERCAWKDLRCFCEEVIFPTQKAKQSGAARLSEAQVVDTIPNDCKVSSAGSFY